MLVIQKEFSPNLESLRKSCVDNGPEYTGKDYKLFAKQWDFKHYSSSPHYPKSNGQIKRMIQKMKKTLKKAFKFNDDPYLALLALQTSPGPNKNTHPSNITLQQANTNSFTINEYKYSYKN